MLIKGDNGPEEELVNDEEKRGENGQEEKQLGEEKKSAGGDGKGEEVKRWKLDW